MTEFILPDDPITATPKYVGNIPVSLVKSDAGLLATDYGSEKAHEPTVADDKTEIRELLLKEDIAVDDPDFMKKSTPLRLKIKKASGTLRLKWQVREIEELSIFCGVCSTRSGVIDVSIPDEILPTVLGEEPEENAEPPVTTLLQTLFWPSVGRDWGHFPLPVLIKWTTNPLPYLQTPVTMFEKYSGIGITIYMFWDDGCGLRPFHQINSGGQLEIPRSIESWIKRTNDPRACNSCDAVGPYGLGVGLGAGLGIPGGAPGSARGAGFAGGCIACHGNSDCNHGPSNASKPQSVVHCICCTPFGPGPPNYTPYSVNIEIIFQGFLNPENGELLAWDDPISGIPPEVWNGS